MHKKIWLVLAIILWGFFLLIIGLDYYASGLPHGPMVDIHDEVCTGPEGAQTCGEGYMEDTRRLDIPRWAKFFRSNNGTDADVAFIIVAIIAFAVSHKAAKGKFFNE